MQHPAYSMRVSSLSKKCAARPATRFQTSTNPRRFHSPSQRHALMAAWASRTSREIAQAIASTRTTAHHCALSSNSFLNGRARSPRTSSADGCYANSTASTATDAIWTRASSRRRSGWPRPATRRRNWPSCAASCSRRRSVPSETSSQTTHSQSWSAAVYRRAGHGSRCACRSLPTAPGSTMLSCIFLSNTIASQRRCRQGSAVSKQPGWKPPSHCRRGTTWSRRADSAVCRATQWASTNRKESR